MRHGATIRGCQSFERGRVRGGDGVKVGFVGNW